MTFYWKRLVSKQMRSRSTTAKGKNITQKKPKEEDEINRILTKANQYLNDSKFQIHWNELD